MIKVNQDISSEEQESGFMNACLSTVGNIAISIAIRPSHHEHTVMTQEQLESHLLEDFAHLKDLGYSIEIQMGVDDDGEENSSTLEGMRCPKCFTQSPLAIWVTGPDPEIKDESAPNIRYLAIVHDEDELNADWNSSPSCQCTRCEFTGQVRDFLF